MIKCPACHHKERNGTLFCSECGAEIYNVIPEGVNEVVLEFVKSGKNTATKKTGKYPSADGKKLHKIPDVDLSQYGVFKKVSPPARHHENISGKCIVDWIGQWHSR